MARSRRLIFFLSLFLFLVLLNLDKASQTSGSHIVGMANLNYVSHNRLLWKLGKELQKRGHEYTQILPNFALETYNDINVKWFNTSITNQAMKDINLNMMKVGDIGGIFSTFKFYQFFKEVRELNERFCGDFFKHENLITELRDSVDLLLCDVTNVCCFILAEKLNVTRVDVSPVGFGGGGGALSVYFFRTPIAYLPLEYSTDPSHKSTFSFTNRLVGFFISHSVSWWVGSMVPSHLWQIHASHNSKHTSAVDAWRPGGGICLIPHDFALEYSRPLGPNVKVIGAVSPEPAGKLPEPSDELPEDLNNFMNMNSNVIVVSFGSTAISSYHPELIQMISDALSKLPFAILWKHTGTLPNNIGSNVKIVKWIPQNDILGHPATKVFITHGGLNSFLESVYHSVPMVVIPLCGDQHRNADLVKVKGLGVSFDKNTVKAEELIEAIHELINNKVYKENVQHISALMKDRQQTPTEEGAHWIEYALRHAGAPHLSSDALHLPEYQLYMFDVFLFILSLVLGIVCMFVGLCYFMCKRKVTKKEKTN